MKFDIAATTILLTFCVAVVVITDRVEGMIDFGSTISNIRTFRKIRESTGVKLIVRIIHTVVIIQQCYSKNDE